MPPAACACKTPQSGSHASWEPHFGIVSQCQPPGNRPLIHLRPGWHIKGRNQTRPDGPFFRDPAPHRAAQHCTPASFPETGQRCTSQAPSASSLWQALALLGRSLRGRHYLAVPTICSMVRHYLTLSTISATCWMVSLVSSPCATETWEKLTPQSPLASHSPNRLE
ncbi:hypothetical protein N658DRAFT_54967 [Parathielavia hyrcaniae]|uniref:Uncharacterized protein n=1 Tax=Parathielavia hyrcaniae TaxID=113614 RepID=A0AAN6PSE9_9PEZI|nr:hypothetical protein N658DRAFT_54967 [Parathielavia hyrcaniae]